jgi:hypothetical protein
VDHAEAVPSPYNRSLDHVHELLGRVPQGRADVSLRTFRDAVGGIPDLARPDDVRAARVWLNAWQCRIGYPTDDEDDVLIDALALWWVRWSTRLPPLGRGLVNLTHAELDDLTSAFEELRVAPAFRRAGRVRQVSSTAGAKLLYALRPDAVTPWDKQISSRAGVAGDFRAHLADARAFASALHDEAAERHLLQDQDLPTYLGRPESTLARIIDEVLYLIITRRQ